MLGCEMKFAVYLPPQARTRTAAGAVLAVRPDLQRAELHHQGRRAALCRRAWRDPGRTGYQPARRRCRRRRRLRPGPGRGLLRQRDAGAVGGALPHARLRRRGTAGADRGRVSRQRRARDQRPFDGRPRRAGDRAEAIRGAIAACRRSRRSWRRRACRGARRRSRPTSATIATTWKAWDATELVAGARERLPLLVDQGDADEFLADAAEAGAAASRVRRRRASARRCGCGPATTTATTSSPASSASTSRITPKRCALGRSAPGRDRPCRMSRSRPGALLQAAGNRCRRSGRRAAPSRRPRARAAARTSVRRGRRCGTRRSRRRDRRLPAAPPAARRRTRGRRSAASSCCVSTQHRCARRPPASISRASAAVSAPKNGNSGVQPSRAHSASR